MASVTLFVSRSPVTIAWIPSRREGAGELDSQGIIDQSQRVASHSRQFRLGSGESAQQHDRFAIGDRRDRFDGGGRRRPPEHRLEGGSCFLSSGTAERAGGCGSHSCIGIGQQAGQARVDVCVRARQSAGDGAHLGIGVPLERLDSRRGQSAAKGRRDADRNFQRRSLNSVIIQQFRNDQSCVLPADRSERVERNRLFRNFAFESKAGEDLAEPAKNRDRRRESAPPGFLDQR